MFGKRNCWQQPIAQVFEGLEKEARGLLPREYAGLGDLVAVDDSLIDATRSRLMSGRRVHMQEPNRTMLSKKIIKWPKFNGGLELICHMNRLFQCFVNNSMVSISANFWKKNYRKNLRRQFKLLTDNLKELGLCAA